MKLTKRILLLLLAVFIIAQAFRAGKNVSGERANDISKTYVVPKNVEAILAKACNDCHSNTTRYPWYAEIQPVGWWLADHVKEGKRHLNFNEFGSYRVAKQYHKLEECMEEIREGRMPLSSYTALHKDAILTNTEKQELYNWCEILRENIRDSNPPDSLLLKRN